MQNTMRNANIIWQIAMLRFFRECVVNEINGSATHYFIMYYYSLHLHSS